MGTIWRGKITSVNHNAAAASTNLPPVATLKAVFRYDPILAGSLVSSNTRGGGRLVDATCVILDITS